ncbi:hypothetical protein AALO_G00233860 [Alosa alosa]|uniref:Uncharacterized protein n=1 Tax=Alosa alosa TaxID=278164 RepID=A0AAV6FZ98_9TELE|nr:hypothetical protein AALO_G00233860 [Alosa alosa]
MLEDKAAWRREERLRDGDGLLHPGLERTHFGGDERSDLWERKEKGEKKAQRRSKKTDLKSFRLYSKQGYSESAGAVGRGGRIGR